MPLGRPVMSSQRVLSSSEKPSSLKSRTSTSGSKMRITSFSPKAVGSVDRRSSTSSPSSVRVLTAVLRAALLHHVHAREDLDAAGHRDQHRRGDLVHLVQHPVDAE